MGEANNEANDEAAANAAARTRSASSATRVLTGLILAGVFGAALYLGWPYFNVLVTAAIAVMAWEWAHLSGSHRALAGALLIATVAGAAVVASSGEFGFALATTGLGTIVIFALAIGTERANPAWLAVGGIYLGLPVVALLWLLNGQGDGRLLVFWTIAAVAATDIGAYFAGRSIGGPKLAPRLSPGKTWSGLFGGMFCAAIFAALYAYLIGGGLIWFMALAGAGLAVVAQAGDLFESFAKRRFEIKDTGHILPGHGGLLDRADGLIAAAAVVAGVRFGTSIAG